jgi:DNA polymerase III epsilon subunit-like protein
MVFTAADVETTGLDARDRIADLAAVELRGHGDTVLLPQNWRLGSHS